VKNPEPAWRTESACEWCQGLEDGKIERGIICRGCGRRVLPPRSRFQTRFQVRTLAFGDPGKA